MKEVEIDLTQYFMCIVANPRISKERGQEDERQTDREGMRNLPSNTMGQKVVQQRS